MKLATGTRVRWVLALFAVAALIASLLGAGCRGRGGEATLPIKLGMAVSLTGGAAAYGTHMKNGAQMVADEINAAGGVAGRKIELVVEDEGSDPSKATTAVMRLITQHNVDAIIGGSTSTLCFAVKDIVEQQGVPFITTSGSNPKLTTPSNKFFFRLHQSDATAARQAAQFVVKILGANRVAVIHDSSDYGVGCRDHFIDELQKLGVSPLVVQTYNVGEQDFSPQLLKIRDARPQVLGLFGNIPEAPLITKQARQLGMKDLHIVMTGISQPKFIELAPGDSEGVFAITPFNPTLPDPEVQEFARKYKDRFAMDPPHQASNSYQAVKVLALVWGKVGTKDRARVAEELKKVEWQAFGSTNRFDATGQVLMKSVVVQVQNGRWVVYKDQL